jgi:hypothetical protein
MERTQIEPLASRWQRALTAAGAFKERDGATDVSECHDAYLADPQQLT